MFRDDDARRVLCPPQRFALERFVFRQCEQSMHLALLLHWHLRGFITEEETQSMAFFAQGESAEGDTGPRKSGVKRSEEERKLFGEWSWT
jgi:hypothetical protein